MNFLSMVHAWCNVHGYLWAGRALQRHIAERRLRRTVREAYRRVPWYRDSFDRHGIDVSAFRAQDLQRLPLLTKQQVAENFPDRIVAAGTDLRKAMTSSTSGSSGQALHLAYSPRTYAYYLATALRVYTMVGYRPWHRMTYIKFMDVERPRYSLGPFFRVDHLNSALPVEGHVEALRARPPDLLIGYASSVMEIARYLQRHPEPRIAPKFISLNSEYSTALDRQFIAEVFGCPVYDEYSSEETWMIASQCRAGHYHVFTDNVVLELLDDTGQPVPEGEIGHVVLTTLNNPLMPLIRYRLGDMARARPGRCVCGSALPMLESFEGRADDALRMPGGRRIPSAVPICAVIRYIHAYRDAIASFKFLQTELHRVELLLVPGAGFRDEIADGLVAELRPQLDAGVELVPRLVDAIDPGRIKRRVVECRVRD
ncbi:MAG: hypothetical protein PHP86_07725 [Nevskiales bacterium]|nr:hypothetical protein [Nevskiales bacterium]